MTDTTHGEKSWCLYRYTDTDGGSPGYGILLPADKCAPEGAVIELGGEGAFPRADVGNTAGCLPVWDRCGRIIWETDEGTQLIHLLHCRVTRPQ